MFKVRAEFMCSGGRIPLGHKSHNEYDLICCGHCYLANLLQLFGLMSLSLTGGTVDLCVVDDNLSSIHLANWASKVRGWLPSYLAWAHAQCRKLEGGI